MNIYYSTNLGKIGNKIREFIIFLQKSLRTRKERARKLLLRYSTEVGQLKYYTTHARS